jgi:hypothetical protein
MIYGHLNDARFALRTYLRTYWNFADSFSLEFGHPKAFQKVRHVPELFSIPAMGFIRC